MAEVLSKLYSDKILITTIIKFIIIIFFINVSIYDDKFMSILDTDICGYMG